MKVTELGYNFQSLFVYFHYTVRARFQSVVKVFILLKFVQDFVRKIIEKQQILFYCTRKIDNFAVRSQLRNQKSQSQATKTVNKNTTRNITITLFSISTIFLYFFFNGIWVFSHF